MDILEPPEFVEEDAQKPAFGLKIGIALTLALAAGSPTFDSYLFDSAIDAGVAKSGADSRSVVVNAYAQAMTVAEITEALSFYGSADGQDALLARRQKADEAFENLMSEDGEDAPEFEPYVASAAEQAFASSAAGKALMTAQINASIDRRQGQLRAIRTDYCAVQLCTDRHLVAFNMMGVGTGSRANGEHAMRGFAAPETFTDPLTADLARAACVGDTVRMQAALAAGADPSAIDGQQASFNDDPGPLVTPLLWAMDCGNSAGVKALLEAGADPNGLGGAAVVVAARNRDPIFLEAMLAAGGNPDSRHDGHSALGGALDLALTLERVEGFARTDARTNWDRLLV